MRLLQIGAEPLNDLSITLKNVVALAHIFKVVWIADQQLLCCLISLHLDLSELLFPCLAVHELGRHRIWEYHEVWRDEKLTQRNQQKYGEGNELNHVSLYFSCFPGLKVVVLCVFLSYCFAL